MGVVFTVVLAALAASTDGSAATNALGWSGTVTAAYSASGHSDRDDSSQKLDMQVTLADGKVVSGTTTVQYAYNETNNCGTNSIKGAGSGPGTSPSFTPASLSTYRITVGLGVHSSIGETSSIYNPFQNCSRKDGTNATASLSLGVFSVTAPGDLATASTLSGTKTLTKDTGCRIGQPDHGFRFDTCTLTITWNLSRDICDPKLINKAIREYHQSDILELRAQQELDEGYAKYRTFLNDEIELNVDIGKEKFLVLQTLEAYDHAAEGTVAGDVLFTDSAALLEYVAFWGGPLFTAAWITSDLIPNGVVPWDEAMARSKNMADGAAKLGDKAKADLEKALSQSKACLEQDRRLREKERLHDEAKKEIEKWEANPFLYMDPTRPGLINQQAAMDKAYEILTHPQTRSPQSRNKAPKPKHVKYSKAQLHAALHYLNVAHAKGATAIAWHQKSLANTDRLRKALRRLRR